MSSKVRMFVKPGKSRDGKLLLVRIPHNHPPRYLKPEGEWVAEDSYWLRRLACHDITTAPEPMPDPPPAPSLTGREHKAVLTDALRRAKVSLTGAETKAELLELATAAGLVR